MQNLRTLIVKKCHFSKAPKHLPNSLRVLEWWRYPSHELPSDFHPKQLKIRELPDMGFVSPRQAELLQASISSFPLVLYIQDYSFDYCFFISFFFQKFREL